MQMSKSDAVLSPRVPVQQFSLSVSSSQHDFAEITPQYVRAKQRRPSGLQARMHTGGSVSPPVCVGRIICDMLPGLASNGSDGSRLVKELNFGLQWAGRSSTTTSTTRTLTTVDSIPAAVSSFLQPPVLTPTSATKNVGIPTHATIISSTSTTTTTTTTIPSLPSSMTRYTSLHTTPPSPSLSDSYALAHPGEVQLSDTMRLDVGVGLAPSLSVSTSSPSPPMLGDAHIFGLSNPQLPPRLIVVNPTPNLTPHPTPPTSPLLATSSSGIFRKGDWLMLPPKHHPTQIQYLDQTRDRSRSEDLDSVEANSATDVSSSASLSAVLPPQPFSVQHHQASTESLVQDLEISASTNSNRHSISSTTTTTSNTDSTSSTAVSTATAATSALLDEAYEGCEVEEPRKVMDEDRWIDDGLVVGSPGEVDLDVDTQPMLKPDMVGDYTSMRLGSLSTIQSMSVKKGGEWEGESVVFTSDEDSNVENEGLGDGRAQRSSTRLTSPTTPTIAPGASTTMRKKKGMGTKTKSKAKTKPVKRSSLRSPISPLSPPPVLHQSTSSSSTNQKQRSIVPPAPPMDRRASSGRSSSRSGSLSGRSGVGVGVGTARTNSSASRSRSRENYGIGGGLLGMTAATGVTRGERKKPVISISTKPKQRPKFMLGRPGSKGRVSGSGKIVSGGVLAMTRRESSGAEPGGDGADAEQNGGDNDKEKEEKERERGRERMIQMQRRQQSLIQQQQLQEMKERMEDEQRALAVQLARQDADAHEAEIRRQRQRHHLEQQQQEMQGGTNGLLSVSSKRPVRFNIGSNSDEGSGVGSNPKSGSEVSGIDGLVVQPVVNSIAKGKGKEQVGGVLNQEMKQQEQHQQQDLRHPHPLQQQHLQHQQRQQQHMPVLHHPAHPPPPQQRVVERQLHKEVTGKEGGERSDPNPNPNTARSTSKVSKGSNNNARPPPPPLAPINTKHSTHEAINLVSSALAAKVKHTLSDPLLPGQHKRTIVLTTSESDFEDSDDDGSWSSEEMGSEDDEVGFLLFPLSTFRFTLYMHGT
ncbi:hypothetical protein BYT27DRAFT_6675283 [Phlegmacium glaucopus]|nr:hypothetical protein BYT27DRAFT_6675283 [Phlegmacium glaucopus]